MRLMRIAIAVSLLATLLAACGGDDEEASPGSVAPGAPTRATGTPSSALTATGSAGEPSPTEATTNPTIVGIGPTVTTSSMPTAPTAPSEDGSGELPSGMASAEDGSGDIVNASGGAPETTFTGVDLSAVTLESDGSALTVTFETHDAIPVEPDGDRLFQIDLKWDDLSTAYILQATYSSAGGWVVSLYDDAALDFVQVDDGLVIDGNTLVVSYPAASFSGGAGPLVWYASATAVDGTDSTNWTDYVPDSAGPPVFSTDDYIPFPS